MYVMPTCFNAGDTIYFPFDTYGASGESITITGLAVTDIEIYKNGSVTQRSSDNGYALLDTDGIDFDGQTGLHGFSVNTGDNSDPGFWADGSQYWVHVSAVTINGQTVRFTYMLPLGMSLRATTPGRTLDVTATGAAGVDWGNVENQGSTVVLSSTTVQTVSEATVIGGSVDTVGSVTSDVTVGGGIITSVTNRVTANVDQVDGVALDTHDAGSFPADVRSWIGSAPNALLSGRVDVSVGAWVDLASTVDFSDNVRDTLSAHGYTTARAAKLDNVDAAVSTRASQTSVDDIPTNAEFAAAFPANFADMVVDTAGRVDAGAIRGFTIPAAAGGVDYGERFKELFGQTVGPAAVIDTYLTSEHGSGSWAGATANENADALLDRADGIETGITPRQALRAIASGVAGNVLGGGVSYRAINNSSTVRIVAADGGSGNRTITLSL